ncbi:MAG: oligosaccharide repeat unit polymerase, partial [Acidobacteria bacterium]|nr:oligosaccharide repeat unit polymerase [Acidobacteriota bacterium]
MFEALMWVAAGISVAGMLIAYDGSRDVFHPLFFMAPMMAFLYAWMPSQLYRSGALFQYFQPEQLVFVQTLNVLGIVGFVSACAAAGLRLPQSRREAHRLSLLSCRRLRIGALIVGSVGLLCWTISIVNVGGFINAFSKSYSGGWDDNGYVRDGNLLLLVGVLLVIGAAATEGLRLLNILLILVFGVPWLAQALLMARRGPTFALMIILLMGSYIYRNKRPPVLAMLAVGAFLGWLSLFLVTNRSNIYLGSNFALTTDANKIRAIVEKSDTGNEYIYGTGAVLAAERRGHYFWLRRYLAQLLVRPIPSSVWPTKYEDFGVPELLNNAGTGEGFADVLGWVGAVGSAPGIIADLWLEVSWFAVVFMSLLGWCFGWVWRRAVLGG